MKADVVTRRRYRIRSKFRFVTFIVILALMIIGGINFATGLGESQATTVDEYTTYIVGYGDTLWDIADQFRDDRTDVRQAIFVISEVNDINAEDLVPGMELMIPVNM